MKQKLHDWLDTEDDDEVKAHIQAALASMNKVQDAKTRAAHKSVSVSLGIAHPAALLQTETGYSTLRGRRIHHHHNQKAARVIKESFAVEIPYPVQTEQIVLLRTKPTTLMVAMPLVKKS